MRFDLTWNEACHPGDYESYLFFPPVWSAPIAVSHNSKYRMWDACMDDVSVGIGLVSKLGLTGVIVQEFRAADENIFYIIAGIFPQPTSKILLNITVDQDHQWVSVVLTRGPYNGHLSGVANLSLCDGEKWKERVKVCFEQFSITTASDRVAPEMMRNSVQRNSCSYGSIEFRFLEVH